MIKFGFKNYQTEFPNWGKHHKSLGILVKRVYEDGEATFPKDERLKEIVLNNETFLKSKTVSLINRKTKEFSEATDYYLTLSNLEYQEANLDFYSVGAMNTKQTTHIRLTFLIEYDKFILDYNYDSSGSYATSFYSMIDSMGFVEDIINDVIEQGKSIEEVGIVEGEDEDLNIIIVSPEGIIRDIEIEKRELLEGLVGVEVYRFEHEITD